MKKIPISKLDKKVHLNSYEVAELLEIPQRIVQQAHNEESTSYRPLFPKPIAFAETYNKHTRQKRTKLIWEKSHILAYKEKMRTNPLAYLTKRRYEKAIMCIDEPETPLRVSRRTIERRMKKARLHLWSALQYTQKDLLLKMLDDLSEISISKKEIREGLHNVQF